MSDLEAKARKVIAAFYAWMDEDGMFPEPQYDDMLDAVNALAAELKMDAVTEHDGKE